MKFISASPENKYGHIDYNGFPIWVNQEDFSGETIKQVMLYCDAHHLNTNAGFKVKQAYYLRGARRQAAYGQVLVGFLKAEALPPELNEVAHCLTFWNQEASKLYPVNKKRNEDYTDFVLRGIAADCRAFVHPYPEQFVTDKGGSHVWIADKKSGERILLFHF